jgi:hypothetical protein
MDIVLQLAEDRRQLPANRAPQIHLTDLPHNLADKYQLLPKHAAGKP